MHADEGVVSTRYARAAMLYLEQRGGHEEFLAGLTRFADAFAQVALLRTMLVSPVVPPARKERTLRDVAGPLLLAESVARFLLLLVRKGRIGFVAGIRAKYERLLDEKTGRLRAVVQTPLPVGPAERPALAAALAQRLGKPVLCDFGVDEKLLGGVLARVGNTVLDSTIKGRLERIRRKVMALSA